jgi:CBS domain containing-hemolysin-like protein
MTILLVVVLVTITVLFFCALLEATLYTTRLGTLEASIGRGEQVSLAQRLVEMKVNIAAPIASILILNTVANTVGATVAGALAGDVLGPGMLTIFSAILTLAVLFFGEIMPKTLAAVYWRQLWPYIVWPLVALRYSLYPLVAITQRFSNLLTRGHSTPTITEDEILAAVRMGATAGQITLGESQLVHNIINLENKSIREIMTPRTVVFSLDAHLSVSEAMKAMDQKGFTRIPIYEEDRENIVGYITIHDLVSAKTLSNPQAPIKNIAKAISFVPSTRDALGVLTMFLQQRMHITIVVDEYGGVAGLLTLEDLIETLLGKEIVDETDRVVDLQERARQLGRQYPSK